MGKSIRCKIKKRLRTAKRQRVDAMICVPRELEHHEALKRVAEGRQVTLSKPKNAFLYPKAPDAVFPQHEIMKPIDFRSEHLPMAAYAFRGNRRKYTGDEAEYMKTLAKTSHPKMEVLAGGGAVLAATGKKVSTKEAELIATAHQNPAGAAVAAAPVSAASAVAAAMEEAASASAGPASASETAWARMDPQAESAKGAYIEPANAVDHSRRPIVKDTRRAKRAAEGTRQRSAGVGKKGKQNPSAPPEKPAMVKKAGKKKSGGGDGAAMQD